MDDLISREQAIKALTTVVAVTPTQQDVKADCFEKIVNLPSAEKHGRWIYPFPKTNMIRACSLCGRKGSGVMQNYCSNCGAKMENSDG